MVRTHLPVFLGAAFSLGLAAVLAADRASESIKYPLMANVKSGARTDVSVTLDVGGDLLVKNEQAAEVKVPMSVAAKFGYHEQILAWAAGLSTPSRSLRQYSEARATLRRENGQERELPADRRVVVVELAGDGCGASGLDRPLTRDEFDLVGDVVGNTLAIDRLLPNRELGEGEGWNHDDEAIGAFLGMDRVAMCDVRSVVTGEENRQVKIRMGGTVHGTVDGAAAEMELRAAYLYDLSVGRITKLNLAIKQRSKPTTLTAGLDVVAKLSVVVKPAHDKPAPFDEAQIAKAAAMTGPELRQLLEESTQRGYRFHYGSSWIVMSGKQRELMSLRFVNQGDLIAHCNIATRPPKAQGQSATLEEFEAEVCKSLGERLKKVEAATEWTTAAGHRCLGVIASGTLDEVPVEWRHYLISGENLPQATISVSVDQSLLERFADADRPIVDSLELLPLQTAKTPPSTASK